MNSSNSSSYDRAAEELDAGDREPGFGAFDGFLEVLGEASVSAEPSEGPFDDLSSGGAPDTDHCCGPAERQSCLLGPIKEAVPAVEAPTIVLT